jgi:mercuric reductase
MEPLERLTLAVTGMTCGSCASHLALAMKTVSGVKDVDVPGWTSGKAVAVVEPNTPNAEIVAAIEAIGYGAAIVDRQPIDEKASEVSQITPDRTDKPKFNKPKFNWRNLWNR